MFKRTALSTMVLVLGLSVTPAQAAEVRPTVSNFEDLKSLDAATKAKFDALLSAGIMDGTSESNFGLQENMNRAQFAKVAALIFNLKVDKSDTTSSFTDVQADDPANGYALPYIEAIKNAGITSGVGNGEFDPAGSVTKEQLATFLVRGLGFEKKPNELPPVKDDTVSNWAKNYVQKALDLKLLDNALDGTFGGKGEASRELLALGGFETAKTFEETKPLEVSGADFAAGNKLNLTLTVGIDASSIDLSMITINGIPLNPKLDSFELSEDKKTIIITLHNGFQLDSSKTPVIVVNGLKSTFGNDVKNDETNKISVTVTEPPVRPTPTVTPNPGTTNPGTDTPPEPTNPNPDVDTPPEPTNPNPDTDTPPEPTNPNPDTDTPPEPTNPNPDTDTPPEPTNPNPDEDTPPEPTNPNPDENTPPGPTNPNPDVDFPPNPTNPSPGTDIGPEPTEQP